MGLVFDPIDHRYTLDGRELLYITQVLHATGIMRLDPTIPPHRLEFARERGTAVHLAIRFASEGRLDASSVSALVEPYLFAFENFCAAHMADFTPLLVEEPMADAALGFAGTPDLIGMLRDWLSVIEIKTCAVMPPGTAVQTAAQKMLAVANGHRVLKRYGLHLRPDGTFRLHEYREVLDEQEFRAALLLASRRLAREGRLAA